MNKPAVVLLVGLIFGSSLPAYGYATITTLAKNDPFPLFTAYQPHNYLQTKEKCVFKKDEVDYCDLCGPYCDECDNHDTCATCQNNNSCVESIFAIFFTPFAQKASRGRNFDKQRVNLSELEGAPWHMLGMVYGPSCNKLDGTPLGDAKLALFPTLGNADQEVPEDMVLVDPKQEIGYFSAPIKYRKTGLRFGAELRPCVDFGLSVYSGVAEIKQTVTTFENLGADIQSLGLPRDGFTMEFTQTVNDVLMSDSQFQKILENLPDPCQLEICDFQETSVEDLYISLWWRRAFAVNEERCPEDWAHFTVTPFISLDATIATGKDQNRKKLLALPFGSDKHNAIGASAGLNFDFYETLEFGVAAGFRHFFARDVERFHLPTHCSQNFLYPFCRTTNVQPGNNIHFDANLHAYRFIDKLSAWVQYAWVSHSEDTYKIVNPESGDANKFRLRDLECKSKFKAQILNTSLYYDISPNISLGFVAQWPLMQRNAYRSTTFGGTVRAVY